MKKISILIFALLATSFSFAQQTGDLQVTINDIAVPSGGPITIMVFNLAEGFPKEKKKAAYTAVASQTGKTAQHTFPGLPVGKYAVSVFQDTNQNGEIDTNFIGFPKEPIGASNLKGLGKPSFDKCTFTLAATGTQIEIKLLND